MMKKLITIFFALYLISCQAWGYDNQLALKAGFGVGMGRMEALESTHDQFFLGGFNTHFGYRWFHWEINLSSYIYLSTSEHLKLRGNNSEVYDVQGKNQYVSFGPSAKYLFEAMPIKNHRVYLSAGPHWSIQSMTYDDFKYEHEPFDDDYKFTYISYGGNLSIGLEEQLPYKTMHPVYYELSYGWHTSTKVSVVDISEAEAVKTLSTHYYHHDLRGHFIMLSMGMALF